VHGFNVRHMRGFFQIFGSEIIASAPPRSGHAKAPSQSGTCAHLTDHQQAAEYNHFLEDRGGLRRTSTRGDSISTVVASSLVQYSLRDL
jgi:hypothetical protein